MFQVSGEVVVRIQNLKKGNEITTTMNSGEIVIGETVTPFVLQLKVRGKIEDLTSGIPIPIGVTCFEQSPITPFMKRGYASLMLICGQVEMQAYIYIKRELLRDFYAAFCMDAVSHLSH
ncbi:MAG: hypothetical protein K8Q97_01110 [Candidatus Andersenbacteria bacterium]|nr:hypothetical protein [Candidatus Andersenbacteria bacterium]